MNLPFLMLCAFSTSEKVPSPFFPIRRYSARIGQGVSTSDASQVGVPSLAPCRAGRPGSGAEARRHYCASGVTVDGPVYLVHGLRGREAGGAVSPPVYRTTSRRRQPGTSQPPGRAGGH
eukprot:scaffold2109_cov123-Isochrysis_galbana.AAC.5